MRQVYRPDCPVSSSDSLVANALVEQPFASLEMGESMDADLLPELSSEIWVVIMLLEGLTRGGWRTGFPDRVRGSADVS